MPISVQIIKMLLPFLKEIKKRERYFTDIVVRNQGLVFTTVFGLCISGLFMITLQVSVDLQSEKRTLQEQLSLTTMSLKRVEDLMLSETNLHNSQYQLVVAENESLRFIITNRCYPPTKTSEEKKSDIVDRLRNITGG